MPATKERMTPEERKAKQEANMARLQSQIGELLQEDGWRNWLRTRSRFHGYSFANVIKIACQRPDATLVGGAKNLWAAQFNRRIMSDEWRRPIWIFAPVVVKDPDSGDPEKRRVVGYRNVKVYDVAQTEPDPALPAIPLVLSAPVTGKLEGATHVDHLHRLHTAIADSDLVDRVVLEDLSEKPEGGSFNGRTKVLTIDSSVPPNSQLRTMVHEFAHAHGVSYEAFTRDTAEVIVDAATYIVCAGIGLDVSVESVPYIAGWGGENVVEKLEAVAKVIHAVAHEIEDVFASS